MYVFYLMHNFIIISSFSSFPHFIICNPVCCDEKCFIFFLLLSGLFCIIVLLFVACLFSFTSSGTYYFYHSQTLFQNQTDRIGNCFEILFPWINLNFPNQLEKLPRIDSKFLNQLEKLPWINPNLSLEEYNLWTQFQSNPHTSYPASF